MDLGLEGKTAVVSGASRGIGRAIAMALAKEGARVGLVSRGGPDLEAAVAEAKGVALVGDVTTEEGVGDVVAGALIIGGALLVIAGVLAPIGWKFHVKRPLRRTRDELDKELSWGRAQLTT